MALYLGVTVGKPFGIGFGGILVLDYNKKNAFIPALLHGRPPSSLVLTEIEKMWRFRGFLGLEGYTEYKAALIRLTKATFKEA
jgi:hypothetical protein